MVVYSDSRGVENTVDNINYNSWYKSAPPKPPPPKWMSSYNEGFMRVNENEKQTQTQMRMKNKPKPTPRCMERTYLQERECM